MLIENLCHVGTMVCLLRRLGLLHVGSRLQNLQLQQHFSANTAQYLSTPVSGCGAVWDACSVHIDMSRTQVTQQTPLLVTNGCWFPAAEFAAAAALFCNQILHQCATPLDSDLWSPCAFGYEQYAYRPSIYPSCTANAEVGHEWLQMCGCRICLLL